MIAQNIRLSLRVLELPLITLLIIVVVVKCGTLLSFKPSSQADIWKYRQALQGEKKEPCIWLTPKENWEGPSDVWALLPLSALCFWLVIIFYSCDIDDSSLPNIFVLFYRRNKHYRSLGSIFFYEKSAMYNLKIRLSFLR